MKDVTFTSAELTANLDTFAKQVINPVIYAMAANIRADAKRAVKLLAWQKRIDKAQRHIDRLQRQLDRRQARLDAKAGKPKPPPIDPQIRDAALAVLHQPLDSFSETNQSGMTFRDLLRIRLPTEYRVTHAGDDTAKS